MSLKDFQVYSKLGNNIIDYQMLGEGAYSSVYKVNRVEDGKIYALKKVKL